MKSFTGLVLGNTNRPEFQFLHSSELDFVRKIFINDNEILSRNNNFTHIISDEIDPDIILIAQSYPDQFPPNFMYQIRRNWSITPTILLIGINAGGEIRTGSPIENYLRIYSFEWNTFWINQLKNYAEKQKSIFDLPPTYSDDEIILATIKNYSSEFSYNNLRKNNSTKNNPNKNSNNICLVVSGEDSLGNDYAMNKLLADYATSLGYNCTFSRQNLRVSPKLTLIDADDSRFDRIIKSVQRLIRSFADSEFNVYINSPRFNEITALQNIGVSRIIPKPFFW
ncbi:MAG: hypothetical protein LBB88_07985 [Planctomycetaceae bacterium]|jgi:hypothetical protein|nr:hypothetical protein [Planctomycetaceae bacterium]